MSSVKSEISSNDNFISLLPNPSSDYISVKLPSAYEIKGIEIYNLSGERVMNLQSLPTFNNSVLINIKDLVPGVYNAIITAGETRFFKTFIKK